MRHVDNRMRSGVCLCVSCECGPGECMCMVATGSVVENRQNTADSELVYVEYHNIENV